MVTATDEGRRVMEEGKHAPEHGEHFGRNLMREPEAHGHREDGEVFEKNIYTPKNPKNIENRVKREREPHEHPQVAGFDIDRMFDEYVALNKVSPYDKVNVLEERARGIDMNEGPLESKVKEVLGDRIRLQHNEGEIANKIISTLFLEGIRADGLKFDKDEPVIEEIRDYLSGKRGLEHFHDLSERTRMLIAEFYKRVADATEDPRIGSRIDLKKDLMNMVAARPGDVAYDKKSALAKIINYIAGQTDNPRPGHKDNTQRRLTYVHRELAKLLQSPRYAIEFIGKFNEILPPWMRLSTAATPQEILATYQALTEIKAAEYNAAATRRTYTLQNGNGENGAVHKYSNGSHAHLN